MSHGVNNLNQSFHSMLRMDLVEKRETTLGSVAIFVGAVLSSFGSELFAVSLASLL